MSDGIRVFLAVVVVAQSAGIDACLGLGLGHMYN